MDLRGESLNVKRKELSRGLTEDWPQLSFSQRADIQAVSPPAHTPLLCGRHWSQAAEALKQVVVLAGFLTRRAIKPVLLKGVKCSILLKKETKPDPAAASFCSPFG